MGDKQAAAAARPDSIVGRTIAGKFRVESLVGRGAMGAVYRATQLTLKKRVAIKVMNADKQDRTYSSRFKREAKTASRMEHPNLLRVIDFGEEPDGLLYIAMEYLEGRDLLRVLREEYPFTVERIVSILSQTLAALAAAHDMGVVHRDLKPENIMLLPQKDDEGNAIEVVKVCDFGVAKVMKDRVAEAPGAAGEADDTDVMPEPTRTATQTGTLTAYGTLIGTPEYMSPEQARGEQADHRSDLYSLGVILFLMLAGRLPFDAKSKIRLVLKHVEEMPPSPRDFDSRVDTRLEAICMKALEKRPEDRWQSAREMRAAVRAVLDPRTSAAPPRVAVKRDPPRRPAGSAPALTPGSGVPTIRETRSSSPSQPIARPKPQELIDAQPTTTIQDPHEAARAIAEARKRLSTIGSVPPPPPSHQPAPASNQAAPPPHAVTTVPPAHARVDWTKIVLAIALVLVVALVVVLATR